MNFLAKIKEQATKITQKLNPKIEVIQITDKLYHCPYPTDINAFKQIINQLGAQKLKIYNLSQYPYPRQLKQKLIDLNIDICQLTYEYYSSMPLTVSIAEVKRIEGYLKSGAKNFALVHCQQNKSRSTVFLAVYYYLSGRFGDVASALAEVNKRLGINSNETVYSSQHLILRNVANYHQDPTFINKQQLKLIKVIINQAPKLNQIVLSDQQPLSLFIEIRRNGKVIYKKITKQFGQGEIVQFNLKQDNVVLGDDCLFSFKYVYREKAYPVARIQINTNFVFNNFLRVQMQEMDIAKNARTTSQVFTDFLLETIPQTNSDLSKLGRKQTHVDIQSHYEKSMNKLSPTLINRRNSKPKQKSPEIKTQPENANQKQEQSKKSKETILQDKPQEKVQQQDAFHINDELGTSTGETQQKLTEQQIDQMLVKMALKKAEVSEQIKQAAEEEQDNQQHMQDPKNSQLEIKQGAQVKQQQNMQQSQKTEKQQSKSQQKQQIYTQNKNQNTEQKKGGQNKKVNEDESHQDVDIDDYLSKLEQQAEQS